MIDIEASRLRDDYLARLDEAMRTLPHGVAGDIRRGVAEELDGLDAEATAARIAQLGDPLDIAREAQDEVPGSPIVMVAPVSAAPVAARRPATSTRGFAIVASLTLGFGGIVVPVLGWLVGAVLVCLSPLWRAGEKAAAILVPLAVATVSVLITSSMSFGGGSSSGSSTGAGVPPEPVNPLIPAWYDGWWSILLLCGALVVPASGLWLLWRLRGRPAA